ncbi:spermidine/putrescine ABC transporter ATP-binding protein [Acidihalobacter prosperus]|uniref:Spermidine/putrescine ABC transporter ATP-binding protein n=1 Tax=Acidihalobacter prosperus TaxID=160660 RepID=A0A1A6C469_9GAMM|nr:spermidine/putrescine ABC transporter ATP-binding protein [Acidihalobacter prosperus]
MHVDGVGKSFGGTQVLQSVTLAAKAGEFVSLLGPSGCGKTTLLRIVAGFERPDAGHVRVDGQDLTDTPAERRNMGMVFQAYSLFPNLTAAQNIRFGLRLRKLPKSRQQAIVADLLSLIGLEAHADRYPHQLSGGQQQRVALARALAIQPSLLLLDEPLSALDAKVRVQLREEIRRIQRETGVTTLFVTHDQEEALSISDRVAVMHGGRLVQFDTPAAIYRDPADAFVAGFIGTATRFDAAVADPEKGLVEILGVRMPAARACGLPVRHPVSVFVRPEAVSLQAGGAHAPAGLAGQVLEHTFLGAVTRVQVAVHEAITLLADVPGALAGEFPVGAEVSVSWAPDAPHVLDA